VQAVVQFYNKNEDYHLEFWKGKTVTYGSTSDNIDVCNVYAVMRGTCDPNLSCSQGRNATMPGHNSFLAACP
jgi:hypothetical protein